MTKRAEFCEAYKAWRAAGLAAGKFDQPSPCAPCAEAASLRRRAAEKHEEAAQFEKKSEERAEALINGAHP